MQPLQWARLALRARLFRNHDPQDQIGESPEPAEKERHQEEQAEQDRVEIEIVAEPAADAGDLPVLRDSMEFFHRALANSPARAIEYQSSTGREPDQTGEDDDSDVSLVAISRAPLEKLEAFRKRMGWSFKWVSSGQNDFSYDYQASFTPQEVESGQRSTTIRNSM